MICLALYTQFPTQLRENDNNDCFKLLSLKVYVHSILLMALGTAKPVYIELDDFSLGQARLDNSIITVR